MQRKIFGVSPDPTPPKLDVYAVRGRPMTFVCGSSRPVTFYRHWDQDLKRSYPCAGADCNCVLTYSRRIFEAFVLGLPSLAPLGSRPLGMICLTQSAYLCVENQISGESWLGLKIRLNRTGNHRNARVEATVLERVPGVRQDPHDIEANLYRIWGINPDANQSKEQK